MKKTKKAKKSTKKNAAKKRPAKAAKAKKAVRGPKPVGAVTHYFKKIKVAIIKFKKPVKAGTRVRVKGATTDFIQTLDSMQFDHKPIAKALPGRQVGAKVKSRVREGDAVFIEKD